MVHLPYDVRAPDQRNDVFNTFINIAYFVLMFASSLFSPLEGLPLWLKLFTLMNPLTWHADALRYLTIGLGSADAFLTESAWFLIFIGLSFLASLRTLQKGIVT